MSALATDDAPGSLARAFVAEAGPISPSVLRLGSGDCSALTLDELETVVAADPEFSLRTLALANSAFYSQQHEISSLRSALVVLGTEAVRNLAASLLAQSLHAAPGAIDEDLWQHCQAAGAAAQMLAEAHRRVSPPQAFAAGLLHDIGMLALQGPACGDAGQALDHAALGAEIADLLGLSPPLSEAIRHHDDSGGDEFADVPLVATVYVANQLAARCGYACDGDAGGDGELPYSPVSSLGLTESDMDTLADGLPARMEKLQGLLGDPGGSSP